MRVPENLQTAFSSAQACQALTAPEEELLELDVELLELDDELLELDEELLELDDVLLDEELEDELLELEDEEFEPPPEEELDEELLEDVLELEEDELLELPSESRLSPSDEPPPQAPSARHNTASIKYLKLKATDL